MRFALKITRPLPITLPAMTIQLDPQVTSLRVSSGIPGGYMGIVAGMPEENVPRNVYLPKPIDLADWADVELRAGSALIHKGRLMKPHAPNGEVRGFTSVGYGLTATLDDYYQSQSTAQITSGALLREVLTKAPLLSISTKPGDWVDPGILHPRAEFDGKFPAEVINQLSTEGGGAASVSAPWDWAVWEGLAASWKPRVPPAVPQYTQGLAGVTIDKDLTNQYGAVAVTYGSAKVRTAEKTDPTFPATYGFRRAINVQGSNVSRASALQFRDTYAALHRVPDYALKLSFDSDHGPTRTDGTEQSPWLVRAGEWIAVADLPMLPILHTEYDAMARTLQLTVGSWPADSYTRAQDAWRAAVFLKRLTSPVTGASLS